MRLLKLAASGVLAAGLLLSQVLGTRVSADIPFAFELSGTKLERGEYQLKPLGGLSYGEVSAIRGTGGAFVIFATSTPVTKGDDQAWLTFNRYGDRYFLSEIRHPNMQYVVSKSRQERELVTSRMVSMQRVTVSARVLAD